MGLIFGIIMIVVYVGMGIALLCGAFDWLVGDWAWLRWTAGIVLIVYGFFRAWRQIKGVDSPVQEMREIGGKQAPVQGTIDMDVKPVDKK